MLKKFIFVTTFFFFVISPAYAQLPNFADLVEDVSPAVVKINTVIKGPKQSAQQNFQGQLPEIFRELLEVREKSLAVGPENSVELIAWAL